MAVVGWAVFKRASSILARNKDKERERERGNGWISTKEGTRRNLIYASVRSSGCVLCEKTLWCIVGWLSGGRIYKVLITACAILTRLVSWYDRPFSTNCEKSPAVNGQTMRLRKVFEPTTRWKDDWLKFRVKVETLCVEMWLYDRSFKIFFKF